MIRPALGSAIVAALIMSCRTSPAIQPQGAASRNAADSSALARQAWARAVRALQSQNLQAARDDVELAHRVWPVQPRYAWTRAILAGRASDTAATHRALADYLKLGLGGDLSAPAFNAVRELSWFAAMKAVHDTLRTPLARSTLATTFADSTIWPEAVEYDARSGAYYLTSVRHGTIYVRTRDGAQRWLWRRNAPGVGSVLALRLDPRRGVLWATSSGAPQLDGYVAADSARGTILMVRASDGEILRRWDIPANTPHALGDIALGPEGDVFVTDSNEPVLYWLPPALDTLRTVRHALFRSLQGIAPTPDPRTIIIADYSHGLLRVEPRSGNVVRVADPDTGTSTGCDGIAWYDGAVIAVQNGVDPPRVARFNLDRGYRRVTSVETLDRNLALGAEPTGGVVVGDRFYYVGNSQWDEHREDGTLLPDARLTPARILVLPLREVRD